MRLRRHFRAGELARVCDSSNLIRQQRFFATLPPLQTVSTPPKPAPQSRTRTRHRHVTTPPLRLSKRHSYATAWVKQGVMVTIKDADGVRKVAFGEARFEAEQYFRGMAFRKTPADMDADPGYVQALDQILIDQVQSGGCRVPAVLLQAGTHHGTDDDFEIES